METSIERRKYKRIESDYFLVEKTINEIENQERQEKVFNIR